MLVAVLDEAQKALQKQAKQTDRRGRTTAQG
jgi:hypothetical protein